MNGRVTTSTIEEAARRLPAVIVRTPLLPARWLTERLGTQVMLKCENLQLAGSFKIRGAYTKVSRLSPYERRRGIITYSSGNHAQAVAMAAKFFDTQAVVVMPETAPQVKIDRTKELGARIVFAGTTSTERRERAEKLASKEKLTMIPPFDDFDIIAGQGTVGRELVQDWPDVQAVLVPVGGGGLIAGIAAWVREALPHARIIGVEPEAAPSMKTSLEAGEPVTIAPGKSIADGLMPVRPGDLTFAHAKDYVHEVVTVPDDALKEAVALLWAHSKIVVEFSGAAGVAALLAERWVPNGLRTAVVITGGNIDPAVAAGLLGTEDARPAAKAVKAAAARAEKEAEAEAEGDGEKPAPKKTAAKETDRKTSAKKSSSKKSASTKSSPKKGASKKSSPKKGAAKKSASKKSASKKSASKKSASKKTAAKKTAAKKTAAKKTASKKTASKKTASTKTASKKGAKKGAAKKSPSKKAAKKKSRK